MGFQIAGVGKACPGRNAIGIVCGAKEFVDLQLATQVTGLKKLVYPSKKQYKELLGKAVEQSNKVGIVERDLLVDKENRVKLPNTYLCAEAVKNALGSANMKPKDVEAFIYASDTDDFTFPSNGILVAELLGINLENYSTADIACVSFAKALKEGIGFIENEGFNNVLIACGDINSRLKLPKNLQELFLFGDGFSAIVLKKAKNGSVTFSNISVEGSISKLFLHMPSYSGRISDLKEHEVYGKGNDKGLRTLGYCEKELWPWILKTFLDTAGLSIDENTKIIIPQATKSVLEGGLELFRKKTNQDIEKNVLPVSSFKHGNTGAGAIPLAYIEALENGQVKENDKVIMAIVGVGGVYTALSIDPGSSLPSQTIRLKAGEDRPNIRKIIEQRHRKTKTHTSHKASAKKQEIEKNALTLEELDLLLNPLNTPTQKPIKPDKLSKLLDGVSGLL